MKQTTYVTSFEITVPLDASCVCRHTSPLQKLRLAPRYLPLPPIHKSPIAVVVVVTLPVAKPIPPTVTRFEAETRYHGGFVIGVTERYLSPSPAPHSGVRVAGLGGAAVTRRCCSRKPPRGKAVSEVFNGVPGNSRRGRPTRRRCVVQNTRSKQRPSIIERIGSIFSSMVLFCRL